MKWLRIVMVVLICIVLSFFFFTRTPVYRGSCEKSHRWYRLPLEGALSSDGSPYFVYFKKGSVNKLMIYFSGGGASWSEESAARPITLWRMLSGKPGYYSPRATTLMEVLFSGIMAKNDPRNPFNDWNYIYLPYATGDFHAGDNDFPYTGLDGKPHILHHRGANNFRLALEAAPEDFRHPEALLVAGDSAGAFAAVANADTAAAAFPGCRDITVYADSAFTEYKEWKRVLRDVWKTETSLIECIQDDGHLIRDWFIRLSARLPDATLLHSNSAFDEILSQYQYKLNHGEFVVNAEALEEYHRGLGPVTRQIQAAVPNYHFYITNHAKDPVTGKTAHTTSRNPKRFYEDKVEGVSVAEWLRGAVYDKQFRNVGAALLE